MRGIWLAAVLVTVTACGTAPAATAPAPAPAPTAPVRYQADGTVLADSTHGPQLCAVVTASLPPQCSGPDIVGWDWKTVEHSTRGGVRWGEYHVVGTWDGRRLTLTEPPRPAERRDTPGDRPDFSTPCPKPAGGRRPADPAKATQEALAAAVARAEKLPGYAGAWLDQSYLEEIDGYDPDDPRSVERHAGDPKRLVLNLRFTGDPAVHEPAIREVWGGALCLSRGRRTAAELRALQERVQEEVEGVYSVSADERAGHVRAGVWVATPERQRQVDGKYGEGLVVLEGFLRPVGS
ncbi:hypothetical protein FHS43_005600 [Streptosporangium becharense]|uniref:Uncharacterized protein n=1 Tax=Streptosporangium becharense TaxID=1816182 RepID=A0A7W9IMX6_9ACTN|nr:hypothetical protein [Streptosporangium becharense]MBB2914288.1 hypothetical protein [Streptosporangium becharense]MBB5823680.1 hypothetical protein [Streptosporangium becharense]